MKIHPTLLFTETPCLSMNDLPILIKKDILIYAFPLFLMNLCRSEFYNGDYWMAIPGCLLAWVPVSSKTRLTTSSILYTLHAFFPGFYFLFLGFILHQAYNSNLLASKPSVVCRFISKIEVVGLLCSELLVIPGIIKLALGVLAIFISITCGPPNIETSDPFENMKAKIDSSQMLNLEYRRFLSGEETSGYFTEAAIFYTEIFYMISHKRILLLFCSFFNIWKSQYLIIPIGVIFLLRGSWEYLCLFIETCTTRNVLFRVCGTYFMYVLAILSTKITEKVNFN